MFFHKKQLNENIEDKIEKLKNEIEKADAIVIGAGAGLSTSAGYTYSGARFDKYFSDFREEYGIKDMYSGGFYPFPNVETYWAWWARHIYVNRYDQPENEVYKNLYNLVKNRDYFVLTTNADHQFQLAGFDKKRMFYTQGDYGLWQCVDPCHQVTYDNEKQVKEMLVATGFLVEKDGKYEIDFANKENWKMEIPSDLIPYCPDCNEPMTMNLRCDDTFVQDEGWYAAKNRFASFLSNHGFSGPFGFVNVTEPARGKENQKILYLELGIGANTPGIIKYPFWQAVYKNPNAIYACINYGEAVAPREIKNRSVCLNSDIGDILKELNV